MYSCGVLYTLPTVTSSSRQSYTPLFKKRPIQFHPLKTLKPKFTCSAAIDDGGPPRNWEKWLPKNLFSAEKVLKSISEATSSPICQFISSPTTFLHTVDPRIKLVILLIFFGFFFSFFFLVICLNVVVFFVEFALLWGW